MKFYALAFASLALAACEADMASMSSTSAGAPGALTTEADFREAIVGKTMYSGTENWFRINSDGSLSGKFDGNALVGTWRWQDRYWCRTLTSAQRAPSEDCQAWVLTETGATMTRNKDAGRSADYSFTPPAS